MKRFLLACLLPCLALAAQAQPAASKSIRLVVPAPAGGGTDLLAREFAAQWTAKSKKTVVVDNVSGANGNVGALQVLRSPPDGQTLLVTASGTVVINPLVYKPKALDPQEDLIPLGNLATVPLLIAVNTKVPVHSLRELVEYTKAGKSTLSYASPGAGSASHLVAELLRKKYGLQLNHVPYRGSSPAIKDLLGGHVDMIVDTVSTAVPFIRTGEIRALAVTSDARLPGVPQIPTTAEQGFSDLVVGTWFGVFAPRGTPPATVAAISDVLKSVLQDNGYKDKVMAVGYTPPDWMAPERAKQFVSTEAKRWADIVNFTGVTID